MNEEQFLNQECKQASSAIKASAKALQQEALEIIDPRRLTREHPWKLVAVAAAAGFVTSKLFTSEDQPLKPERSDKPPDRKKKVTLSRILAVSREILTVARPILDTVWAAALAAAHGHQGNGEHLPQTPTADPPNYPSQS
jgi:hypothetical protein